MSSQIATHAQRLGWIFAALAGIALFFAFTFWAGIPSDLHIGIFWAQIILFFVVACAFVGLTWHLLIRPMASHLRQPRAVALPVATRQKIALLLAGGGIALVVGAFWDEVWHRIYGIPFGEDFFWRPHLLMYFGFTTAIVVGFWALNYLNRHLKGSFQQRFRANALVGLLILNAAFMLYALPTDPLWHLTYGEDLSAWSVPHLILLASFILTLVIALVTHLSTVRQEQWRTIFRFHASDVLPLFLSAAILLIWLQLMLIDWDVLESDLRPDWSGLYRPEWLLAANLTAGVTFAGIFATRLFRCAGLATAAGLLALAVRYGLIQVFGAEEIQYSAWVAALLPLLAIDLWSTYCGVLRRQEPNWYRSAFAVAAAMMLNAVVIRGLYDIEPSDSVSYGLAILITALGVSWLCHQVIDWLQATGVAGSPKNDQMSAVVKPRTTFGLLGGFALFIVIFIATASPPI